MSTDLGCGHSLRYAGWHPDRSLNPRYEGIPDIPRCQAIVRHELRPDDPLQLCRDNGYCEGVITFDIAAIRQVVTSGPYWQVLSWDPLTLDPSLQCHCGDHGFIRDGRWVPA